MCGIAGIYAYHPAAGNIDHDELITIRDHMIARGPDGEGEWFSEHNRVGLGHRRLSIIDLSDAGQQPMQSRDGRYVIVFNGEIYNYKALKQGLKARGHPFSSDSDTEVLLALYTEYRENMLHQLRGMFAFAIWDNHENSLFLARDPYGIKPLYYADDGWTIRLASQVKALLAGGRVSQQKDPAGEVGFLLLGSIPDPYTLYQNIKALPAGHYLWVKPSHVGKPIEYFSLTNSWAAQPKHLHEPELRERVRQALQETVEHHMVADVPVGVFLSAGIDSGALTGLMTQLRKNTNPVHSICLAFEEFRNTEHDESPLAQKVAETYGTDHSTRYVTEEEFHEDLPRIMAAMDQPSIDGINTWFVAKAAKEKGLKVAVSGLGGDELFGGYPSFRDIPRWVNRMSIPSRIPFLGNIFRHVSSFLLPANISPKVTGMVKYGGYWHSAWLLKRGLFLPWELQGILDEETLKTGIERLSLDNLLKCHLNPKQTEFGKVASMEGGLYMKNQLLRDADWAGMAHSLEIRVPLVDSHLLTALAPSLAGTQTTGKQVLADAPVLKLPEQVTDRAKTGFQTPVVRWQKKYLENTTASSVWARSWCQIVRRKYEESL